MSYENVSIIANGVEYHEWESITVTHDYGYPVVYIEMQTTEVIDRAWEISPFVKWSFPPGTLIQIYANGAHMATGIVQEYYPSATPTGHRVRIVAHSQMSSGVFNSYHTFAQIGTFYNMPLPQVLRQLWSNALPGGSQAPLVIDEALNRYIVGYHQVRPGASPYQETGRLAPMWNVWLRGLRQSGGLHFHDGSGKSTDAVPHSGGYLIQGHNIISMSGQLKAYPRVQRTEAQGQTITGTEQDDLQPSGIAVDDSAISGSYRLHMAQGQIKPTNLQLFANYMRQQTFFLSVNARIQVPGWRVHMLDKDDLIPIASFWDTGELVRVYSRYLKIDCDMFVMKLEFHQDSRAGTTTTLTVTDPRAVATIGALSRCNNADVWGWGGVPPGPPPPPPPGIV